MNSSFSIIIPLYNKAKTISKTLDSITNLEGTDYEIVVVDDGSTDDGPQIVQSYQSNKLKLFRKPNGGVSSARNYGAEKARNSWLIFLDADDLLTMDCLQIFGDLINRFPRDEVFVGNFIQKFPNKTVTRNCKKEFVSENPHRDIWLFRFYMRPGAFCVNKHAFLKSGGYDERMSFNEDFEYCMRLSSLFRVVATPKIVMEYVMDHNEASGKKHPLERNFAYYIPYMNISNTFLKYEYYHKLCSTIKIYKKHNDNTSVGILSDIKLNKFDKLYPLKAWFLSRILLINRIVVSIN